MLFGGDSEAGESDEHNDYEENYDLDDEEGYDQGEQY